MFFFDCNITYGTNKTKENQISTVKELTRHMEHQSLDAGIVFNTSEYDIARINAEVAKDIKDYDNLYGLWSLIPKYTNESPQPSDIVDKMQKGKIVGLKYSPDVNRFVSKPFAVKEYLDIMVECRIPLFVNTDQGASLSDLADMKCEYPDLTVVLTYPNVWPSDRMIRPFVAEFKNIYLDMTYNMTAGGLESFTKEFGTANLLYGSGFPNSYINSNMFMIKNSLLSDEEKQLIAGQNLKGIVEGIRYE